jgi:hypothetical protein
MALLTPTKGLHSSIPSSMILRTLRTFTSAGEEITGMYGGRGSKQITPRAWRIDEKMTNCCCCCWLPFCLFAIPLISTLGQPPHHHPSVSWIWSAAAAVPIGLSAICSAAHVAQGGFAGLMNNKKEMGGLELEEEEANSMEGTIEGEMENIFPPFWSPSQHRSIGSDLSTPIHSSIFSFFKTFHNF